MSQVYCLLFLFYVTVSFVTFVHLGASIEITEAENFLVGSFGQFYLKRFKIAMQKFWSRDGVARGVLKRK